MSAARVFWMALVATAVALGMAGTPAVARTQSQAVPATRQASKLAIVTVRGVVDEVTRASVLRRLREAEAQGANAIVLELDTPGGDLAATLEICLALKDLTRLPVHAWVHPKAFSAGTILALACRSIVVSPNAVFGDAAPIQAAPGLGLIPLPPSERAKIEAPLLAEVVDSARRGGYDETLVRTFVTTGEEAWMLRNRETDERIFVGRSEYRAVFGEDPPTTRSAGPESQANREKLPGPFRVLPGYDDRFRAPGPTDEEIAAREEHVEFMQLRPPSRKPLTAGDRSQWELVAQVDGADELLVVYAPEAQAFGLASGVAANDGDLLLHFGATTGWRLDENWGDALVRFLTSWPVRLLLVIVLLVGFIVEVAAPGVGWFGGAATVALVLLLGAPMLAGVQTWWPLAMVAVGLALVLVEVFIIPGTTVAGLIGGALVLVGLVASFVHAPLGTPSGQSDLTNALGIVVGGGIVSSIVAWGVLRVLPRTPLGRAAILEAVTAQDHLASPAPVRVQAEPPRVGTHGVTVTPLRPVGKATFGDRLVEVQSVGSFVDERRPVVVVRSSAYAVEVEEIPE